MDCNNAGCSGPLYLRTRNRHIVCPWFRGFVLVYSDRNKEYKMTPKELVISKLLQANYRLYIPLNSESNEVVIEIDSTIKLCLVRKTRNTKRGPNIIFGDIINISFYQFIIAVESETERCWLIPTSDLDLTKNSMMLSAFNNSYAIVRKDTLKTKVYEKRREIKIIEASASVSGKTVVPEEDRVSDEDLMNLLKGSK